MSTKWCFGPFVFVVVLMSFIPDAFAALRVDDFAASGLGGRWVSYADPHSYVSPHPFSPTGGGHGSDQCARLEFELKQGVQYPFAGMSDSFTAQNLSTYEGVRFWAKGQGLWNCMIPIPATAAEYNHYSAPFTPGLDWKLYEIPFSKLKQTWGTSKPWDPRPSPVSSSAPGQWLGTKVSFVWMKLSFTRKARNEPNS